MVGTLGAKAGVLVMRIKCVLHKWPALGQIDWTFAAPMSKNKFLHYPKYNEYYLRQMCTVEEVPQTLPKLIKKVRREYRNDLAIFYLGVVNLTQLVAQGLAIMLRYLP